MQLSLQREISKSQATLGELFHEKKHLCFTLEDQVREIPGQKVSEWKIKGITAIPVGSFEIKWTFSQRFQKFTFQLMDVPGFEGIRIHAGNSDKDTEGCILVGTGKTDHTLTESRKALEFLENYLKPYISEGVFIDILPHS